MRFFIIKVLILIGPIATYGQLFNGLIRDAIDQEPVQFSHIVNLSKSLGTVSDANGYFSIEVKLYDTLSISSVGYKSNVFVVDSIRNSREIIYLVKDTTRLDSVTVSRFPSEDAFKRRILETETLDTSFWYHGLPKPGPRVDVTLSENYMSNPLIILSQPFSYFYYNFSKYEKERRKYHKITTRDRDCMQAYDKLDRFWVSELTGLTGDALTSFIAFCDFSIAYLCRTPEYILREELLAKHELFKNGIDQGEE